jgi:hypothetical protein
VVDLYRAAAEREIDLALARERLSPQAAERIRAELASNG